MTLPGCTPQCTTNTDCGTCEKCENKACVPDMTLPGCTPQCTTNTDCGTCEKCENKACVPDMTQPGCTKCDADTDCSGGACCCADGTCSADCCNTKCNADDECPNCQLCDSATGKCQAVPDGNMCGDCKECQNGQCVDAGTTVITKCDRTTENCCSWNGTYTCEDETGCCTSDAPCNKENCETCNNGKCVQNAKQTVTDCDGNKRTCCSADDTCKTMECQDAQVCTYTPPNTITKDEITECMAQLKCSPGKCPKDMVETIIVCYKAIGGCACEEIGTLTGCIKK